MPLVEFAYNNLRHLSTDTYFSFANYLFYLYFNTSSIDNCVSVASNGDERLGRYQVILNIWIQKTIKAKDTSVCYYDQNYILEKFLYSVKVWPISKKIKTRRINKKLDHKQLGLFTIFEAIRNQVYCHDFIWYKTI